MTTVHVYPSGDLVEHDTDGGDCVCVPTTDPVVRDDGSIGWVIVHHSLDGREASESPGHVDRRARERAEQAMAEHEPCTDCVRCETCRREWCPTVVARCPGEESWWRHPTGGYGGDDQAYCYRCTVCPGGYFQFHLDAYPACTEVQQAPHVIADGKGWD